jgi:hypothetical protein
MKMTKANSGALTLVLAAAVSMAGAIASFPAEAQDAVQDRLQERTRLRIHEPSQLMSTAERDAYLARVRTLRNEQEGDALRLQQREQIQQRARLQVNKQSDQASMRRLGPGFGPDAGPGPFAGPGPMYSGGGFGGAGSGGRGR